MHNRQDQNRLLQTSHWYTNASLMLVTIHYPVERPGNLFSLKIDDGAETGHPSSPCALINQVAAGFRSLHCHPKNIRKAANHPMTPSRTIVRSASLIFVKFAWSDLAMADFGHWRPATFKAYLIIPLEKLTDTIL